MPSARLKLVPPAGAELETAAQRIRYLQQEAHSLARAQVQELQEGLQTLSRQALEIAEGGEAYPIGARELARRMVEELGQRSATLEAILRKR